LPPRTPHLSELVPGGAHTYSRGADQFPMNAPDLLVRGKGAFVWGEDKIKLLDYGMALRSVTIGYADRRVNRAAIRAMGLGNNLTRPSVIEHQAAQKVIELVPSVEMVKFAKNGSNVVTASAKMARAYTGKKYIAVPRSHPFFSFDDWFIGTTTMPRGVPEEHSSLTLKFDFNDPKSLARLFDAFPGDIAAVIMEPATGGEEPAVIHKTGPKCVRSICECSENFLQYAKRLCEKNNALLVLDEMITGFRWGNPGAHTKYHVKPDLLTYGKAISNGFSVSFLGGKREVMNVAGIDNSGEERVFLLSSTHGAEMSSLAAMIESLGIVTNDGVVEHLHDYGSRLKANFNEIAESAGIGTSVRMLGADCSPILEFNNSSGVPDAELRTLFMQEMISNGVMMPWVALSASHGDKELKVTTRALEKTFVTLKSALDSTVLNFLHGPAVQPVFRKFN